MDLQKRSSIRRILLKKMRSFGFYVTKVNGREEQEISQAIDEIKAGNNGVGCIVLDTVKGQGVPFFEELQDNHSVKFDDTVDAEADKAIQAFQKQLAEGWEKSQCGNC